MGDQGCELWDRGMAARGHGLEQIKGFRQKEEICGGA